MFCGVAFCNLVQWGRIVVFLESKRLQSNTNQQPKVMSPSFHAQILIVFMSNIIIFIITIIIIIITRGCNQTQINNQRSCQRLWLRITILSLYFFIKSTVYCNQMQIINQRSCQRVILSFPSLFKSSSSSKGIIFCYHITTTQYSSHCNQTQISNQRSCQRLWRRITILSLYFIIKSSSYCNQTQIINKRSY